MGARPPMGNPGSATAEPQEALVYVLVDVGQQSLGLSCMILEEEQKHCVESLRHV